MPYQKDGLERERLRKRRNYYKNLEVERARTRESKRKQFAKRRDEINLRQRERYARNAASEARKQNERRHKREPHRGLGTAIRACDNGTLSVFELNQLVERRFAEGFAWLESTGRLGPRGRRIYRQVYAPNHQEHLSVGEREKPSNSNNVPSRTG